MTARVTSPFSRGRAVAGATLPYQRGRGRALPEPPRLVVTAGPARGAEHRLCAHAVTVGRGPHNALVLPDLSVSRHHARLEKHEGRWVLFDQGSGSGTRVNGKRIERHALQDGDEIQLGDTKARFVEPGGVLVNFAAPPPQAPARSRARLPRTAFAGGLVLLAVAVSLAVHARRRPEPEVAARDDESRAFARKRFDEAVALLQEGNWAAARDKLRIAADLDGHDEQIARYVEEMDNEAPLAARLDAAREALARKDYETARVALAVIPDGSLLAASAAGLTKKLRGAKASRPAAPPPSPKAELRRRARPSPEAIEAQRVLDAYLSGDVAEALRRARGGGAADLLEPLQSFDGAYRDGLALLRAGREMEALSKLEQARAADLRITGGAESRMGRAVEQALAPLHIRIAAALPLDDEALPLIAAHVWRAVAYDPEDTTAQRLQKQVARRCGELYLRAYVEKDEDPQAARKDFALVAATLPASDETGRKARLWLQKLDGKEPHPE